MKSRLMLGFWRVILGVPRFLWQRQIRSARAALLRRFGDLGEETRCVHHATVRMLPSVGKPLAPASIAKEIGLPEHRVAEILEDLEQKLTFLWRNKDGNVSWAYPVTVEETPHRLTFSSGETLYAA
ncbi:hypothetical protein ACFL59_00835 [Planctomycetota bacterium]